MTSSLVACKQRTARHRVRLVYLICDDKDGKVFEEGCFQAPSHENNSTSSALQRIAVGSLLIQHFFSGTEHHMFPDFNALHANYVSPLISRTSHGLHESSVAYRRLILFDFKRNERSWQNIRARIRLTRLRTSASAGSRAQSGSDC